MNIAEQLNSKGATPETILQILKTSMFEASGDLSPAEMKAALRRAAGNSEEVDQAVRDLETKPELIGEIALLWISQASNDPATQGAVEGAIAGADRQMPLMETGAIALVALYAIYMVGYMLGPNKPLTMKKKIKQKSDGSYEEEEETAFLAPDAAIKKLLEIFSKSKDET